MTLGSKSLITLVGLTLWLWSSAFGQLDTANFESEVFQTEDLDIVELDNSNRITAANRVLENADELAVRTIIVTKDDIRRNGFVTLVDVLKTLPGFRTSQPGSAQLGETFLMRGLVGNIYTKILVNGIPIEPSAMPGMAIGAQLPIQAAERIEIILGPQSSVFGADAMAGVINIVMADVDRPIEAYGGASLGSQNSTYLHLSLGGKFGKGKNVVDYNLYAAGYGRDNVPFLWRDSLNYAVDYQTDSLWLNPLWRGDPDNDSIPNFRDMPQSAQLLGVHLKYRDLSYTYSYMSRYDPSGLGSYFTDIDHSNANSFWGDIIQTHHLKYEKSLRKVDFISNLSFIDYYMDENSSYDGINHPISNERNFMYAESRDIQFEQLVNYRPGERWNILMGINGTYSFGSSFQNYMQAPYVDKGERPLPDSMPIPEGYDPIDSVFIIENSSDDWSLIEPFSIFDKYEDRTSAAFIQGYYHYKKWKVIAGLRFDNTDFYGNALSPKMGIFFKPKENIRLRGTWAAGFRGPGNYYYTNNYRGTVIGPDDQFAVSRRQTNLEPENMTSLELGGDFLVKDKWVFTVHAFHHTRYQNLVPTLQSPQTLLAEEDSDEEPGGGGPGGPGGSGGWEPDSSTAENYDIGFYNSNSSSTLTSIQGFISYDNHKWLKVEAFGQINIGQEQVEFELLDTLGEEESREFEYQTFSEMPNIMGGVNLHFSLGKGFYVSVYTKAFSKYTWGLQAINGIVDNNPAPGYYNVDGMISCDLGKRLTFYTRVNNVTRSTNRGIYTNSVSGYQYAYMPQLGRTMLAGLTFDLNRKEESR